MSYYACDPCGCLHEAYNGRLVHPCSEHSYLGNPDRQPIPESLKERLANALARFLIEGEKDIQS